MQLTADRHILEVLVAIPQLGHCIESQQAELSANRALDNNHTNGKFAPNFLASVRCFANLIGYESIGKFSKKTRLRLTKYR